MPSKQYVPTPTDAVVQLSGWQTQPANPIYFSSDEEAKDCLKRMIEKGIVPSTAVLVDNQFAIGPIQYGKDGRKVWTIDFTLKKQNYSQPVGWILWAEGTYGPNVKLYANPDSAGIDIQWG